MQTPLDFAEWEDFLDAQGRGHREMLFELARRYDMDFLAFICAYDGDGAIVDVVPTDPQREVIEDAYQRSEALAQIPDYHDRRIATAQEFGGYVAELGTTRAVDWHRRCGGRVPEVEDDGSVEAALRILAGDFLGFRLLPRSTHINAVLGGHPMYEALFQRFGDDEPLGRIFDDAVARSNDVASFHKGLPRSVALLPLWCDGTCQTLQFHNLPAEILSNARVEKYVPSDCVGAVQDAAVADLECARALSSGKPVTVPTYVGLAGVRLGDDVDHIGFEGIRLRRTTPLDPGCLNATTQIWTVAEVDTEIRYLHNKIQKERRTEAAFPTFEPRAIEHTNLIQEHARTQADIIERLRFAVLLSSGVEEALATTEIFRAVANPIVGTAARIPSGLPHNSSAHEVSKDVADALEEWLPKVASMPDQLMLPMRRLLRAAAERDDPVDRLIDAVIAWEGLFGANPEIKFQVTGAMSVLLETENMEKRSVLMAELGKIYGIRSTFVHGSGQVGDRKLPRETVEDRATRAVAVAISVFREVLRRPDLVAITESRLRSQRILVGF